MLPTGKTRKVPGRSRRALRSRDEYPEVFRRNTDDLKSGRHFATFRCQVFFWLRFPAAWVHGSGVCTYVK